MVALDMAAPVEQVFEELVTRWKHDTELLSSVNEMALHPDYQAIIGLGPAAIPLILRELRDDPDHWLWALRALVRVDVAEGSESFAEACQAWVEWGYETGYLER